MISFQSRSLRLISGEKMGRFSIPQTLCNVCHIDSHQSVAYSVWQIATLFRESIMATSSTNDARINFRLPSELKQIIEQAASELGQTVSDFTVSTLVREAREVLQQTQQTRLSNEDRNLFLKALESADAKPNDALKAAARRYKKRLG